MNASHLVLTQYDLVTMANTTLHEIISHIETTYDVRISIPERYADKRYTFNYQRSNSLDEVLHIVEYMTGETAKSSTAKNRHTFVRDTAPCRVHGTRQKK